MVTAPFPSSLDELNSRLLQEKTQKWTLSVLFSATGVARTGTGGCIHPSSATTDGKHPAENWEMPVGEAPIAGGAAHVSVELPAWMAIDSRNRTTHSLDAAFCTDEPLPSIRTRPEAAGVASTLVVPLFNAFLVVHTWTLFGTRRICPRARVDTAYRPVEDLMLPDYRTLIDEITEAHAALDRLEGFDDPSSADSFTPATEDEVNEAESRLSCKFPPSYREFLLTVNGCAQLGLAHGGLLPVSDVTWFRDSNSDWIHTYTEAADNAPEVTEDEHLAYADDCVRFRLAYLPHLLQIGDEYDGSVYLLNPLVTTSDGEWEAWAFANWYPGATRSPSFADLVTSTHREVLHELNLTTVPIDEAAVLAKALPVLREQISQGETPGTAITKYVTSQMEVDEMFAAWMRTTQPYYALLEALGYRR